MNWYQEWFGDEYLDLYSYRDEAEAELQSQFFSQLAGPIAKPIIDVACGSGRHLRQLERLGYRASGCDLSPQLLAAAHRHDPGLKLTRADMRNLPFRTAAFGAAVSFFTSFGYFESDAENSSVVREIARVLQPGSPLLFDYLNANRGRRRLVPHEERRTERGIVQIDRWFDESSGTFNKRIQMGGRTFYEHVRGYSEVELEQMMMASGLRVVKRFGDFHGTPFEPDSARVILFCERKP